MFKRKIIIINCAILVLFIVDRFLKSLFLQNPKLSWDFFILKFELWQNHGIAFGLKVLPAIITPLIIVIVFLLLIRLLQIYREKKTAEIFFLSLIIAGAISNLIDRLNGGEVIDYINLFFWPVFNLADAMIVIGALLWCIWLFKNHKYT